MKSLTTHILESAGAQKKKPRRADDDPVRVIRSRGIEAATVALPGGIDLESRADRINSFWRALVEFQHRDVFVVAICADDAR